MLSCSHVAMSSDGSHAIVPAVTRLLQAAQQAARHAVRAEPPAVPVPKHPHHSVCALARAGGIDD